MGHRGESVLPMNVRPEWTATEIASLWRIEGGVPVPVKNVNSTLYRRLGYTRVTT